MGHCQHVPGSVRVFGHFFGRFGEVIPGREVLLKDEGRDMSMDGD